MGTSVPLGTLYGITIKVHPTFVLLVIWVMYQWGFAAGAGLRGIIFGLVALVAVFACVLLHELAHARVAQRYGLTVQDIVLLPVGGVARIEQRRMPPRVEIQIALAGPLLNLAIAAILSPIILLVALLRHVDHPLAVLLYADEISVAGFILYLWIANLLLACFNLIPAFPMDGGRVLRAVLVRVLHSRLRATRWSVLISQCLAMLMFAASLFLRDPTLGLVAVFVLLAAAAESRQMSVQASLANLPAAQFALWDAGGVRPSDTLSLALRGGARDMAVTEGGRVVGMVYRSDLIFALRNGDARHVFIRDIMSRTVETISGNNSMLDAQEVLARTSAAAVVVVDDGLYRGLITADRLQHVAQHIGDRRNRRRGPVSTWLTARLRAN